MSEAGEYRRARPYEGMELNGTRLADLATLAIDQVVIDGIGVVDDTRIAVPFGELADIAFGYAAQSRAMVNAYRIALDDDARRIPVARPLLGFRSEMSAGSTVRPRPVAIMQGTAREVTEQEYAFAMARMEHLAQAVIKGVRGSGIINMRAANKILRDTNVRFSRDEYKGLEVYVGQSPHFKMIEDGRFIVLDRFSGNPEDVQPLPAPYDLDAVVDQALRTVQLHNGLFRRGALLGAIRASGVIVPTDQVQEIYARLDSHPAIQFAGQGRYRLRERPVAAKNPSEPKPTAEPERSLDDMLRTVGGARSRKPKGRRGANYRS